MAELMLVNPRKRRRKKSTVKRKTTRRRKNPVSLAANPRRRRRTVARKSVRRSRRRNPSRRMNLMTTATKAFTAAGGALALDLMWGYAPIPETLKAGPMKHVVKAAGAIGMGMLAGMVVKKDTANQMALGALTVVAHSALTDAVSRFAPNIKLGENDMDLGYWSSGYQVGTGNEGMGEYLTDDANNGSYMGAYVDSEYA